MTKEEYQKNLVRMFDSLRTEHKGDKYCDGIDCRDCPFDKKVCNADSESFHAHEAIEIVENWAKENPIVTNADKFKEMFGLDVAPQISSCINFKEKCADCKYYDYNDCKCDANKRFWNAEYKEQTKE